MKPKNLTKGKKKEDLEKLLSEKREAFRQFNFGSSGSRGTNVKEARNIKKDVARILTALKETSK